MKNKTFFLFGGTALLFVSILSTSQTSFKSLSLTPTDELIEKLPDAVSRKNAYYVVKKNEENVQNTNTLQLAIRPIKPVK